VGGAGWARRDGRTLCRVANAWFESVAVAQRRAKRRLPKSVYGALIAGADRGITMGDNTAAFDELGFRPVTAGQSPTRDMGLEVMGQHVSMPVLISPTGVQAVHPDGEVAVARAAAARGVAMGLSSFASKPIEDVVAANPQTFFQIYWAGDRDSIVARMDRARAAGAVGIIVTLDWSFVHSRDWGSPKVPSKIDLATVKQHALEVAVKPGWLLEWVRSGSLPGFGVPNFALAGQPVPGFFDAYGTWMGTPPPTWDDIAWLRAQWDGPFMVKGIGRADEARRAVDAGVSAISVSNHGGNNLDGTPAPIRVLPEIAAAVGGDVEVLLDGGHPPRQRRGEGARARRQGRDDRPGVPVGARRERSGRGGERARRAPDGDRLDPARPRQVVDHRAVARRPRDPADFTPR
jgi:pre-mycofactocin synthase